MTDGIPSSHLLPPRGIIESLEKSINNITIKPSIYTFGFGYSLDTKLLSDIANIGNGTFSFIPDSGFVGTIIIHAMANIKTACGTNAILKSFVGSLCLEPPRPLTILALLRPRTLVLKSWPNL